MHLATCACGAQKRSTSTVCTRCSTQAGPSNGNWQGGRIRHRSGYVMVKDRQHPRGTKSGYVFEHILVMEAALGRHLHPEETVHHLNGVKDDNRRENLELWTRPQPTGIRVEDAIAWAHALLARYGAGAPGPAPSAEEACRPSALE